MSEQEHHPIFWNQRQGGNQCGAGLPDYCTQCSSTGKKKENLSHFTMLIKTPWNSSSCGSGKCHSPWPYLYDLRSLKWSCITSQYRWTGSQPSRQQRPAAAEDFEGLQEVVIALTTLSCLVFTSSFPRPTVLCPNAQHTSSIPYSIIPHMNMLHSSHVFKIHILCQIGLPAQRTPYGNIKTFTSTTLIN